jgi:hypothetical protein
MSYIVRQVAAALLRGRRSGASALGAPGGHDARAHLPARAAFGGAADQAFQRVGVAFAHDVLQRVQRLAEALRLLEHFFAVGHQDVAPGLRAAGGDAGEVAEARPGQRQEVRPAGWLTTALK